MPDKEHAEEQEDVLPTKGNVTEGSRGLQQWGDEAIPEGPLLGNAASGTAERAAKITRAQRAHDEAEASGRDA